MSSSPGPSPAAQAAACSAAVPLLTTTASAVPARSASASSNASTTGPVVSQSERSTAATAAMSASSTHWRPYGRVAARTGVPPSMASRSGKLGLPDHGLQRLDAEPLAVGVAGVGVAVRQGLTGRPAVGVPPRVQRQDDVHVVQHHRVAGLVRAQQALVQLL